MTARQSCALWLACALLNAVALGKHFFHDQYDFALLHAFVMAAASGVVISHCGTDEAP